LITDLKNVISSLSENQEYSHLAIVVTLQLQLLILLVREV